MKAMECEEVRPRLDAYLDGEVAESERALLHQHLAGCH
jgi:predicted anti-sigma-YlaC factor YlaD